MKLNPDCVRDVLIYLEENLCYADDYYKIRINDISLPKLTEALKSQHTEDDIRYSTVKLYEIGYISTQPTSGGGGLIALDIKDITWHGHEFLNTVRGKTIWEATKSGAAKIGVASIKGLFSVATEITKAIITQPDFIQKIVNSLGS